VTFGASDYAEDVYAKGGNAGTLAKKVALEQTGVNDIAAAGTAFGEGRYADGSVLLAQGTSKVALTALAVYGGAKAAAQALPRRAVAAGTSSIPRGLPVLEPHFRPNPTAVLQNLTTEAAERLGANPSLAETVLERSRYAAGQRDLRVARMEYGNAVERLVAQEIRESPLHRQIFEYVSGPNNPDFVGRGIFAGNLDITTPGQIGVHLAREGYGAGLQVVTYQRPATFKLFP
jgi:hypothetical protein